MKSQKIHTFGSGFHFKSVSRSTKIVIPQNIDIYDQWPVNNAIENPAVTGPLISKSYRLKFKYGIVELLYID